MKAIHGGTESGMILMAGAMLVVPGLDAIAKLLAETLSPGQVALARFVFQTVFLLPLVLWKLRPDEIRPTVFHFLGGPLLAGAILSLVWAFQYLPLANAIAIFFVEPLLLTLFSAVILREQVGWRRTLASAIGLVGALIVIRPNWAAFGWATLLPLFTAACYAGYLVVTRHVAASGSRVALQFWGGLTGAAVLLAATLIGDTTGLPLLALVMPAAWQWPLLVGLGLLTAIAHLLIANAFGRAPASVLAPFQYLEIISATILGLLIFGDFPDAMTWAGTAVIVGSGLYVFHRERKLARRPHPAATLR